MARLRTALIVLFYFTCALAAGKAACYLGDVVVEQVE
jgi:hypothetical protein